MRRHLGSVWLLALVALGLGPACRGLPGSAAGRGPSRPAVVETELAPSAEVPGGAVAGVTLDATTGQPVEGAQVYVPPSSGRPGAGTVSDTAGRFRLEGLGPGRAGLHVRRFGYASEVLELPPGTRTGYAARIALRPVPVELCVDYGPPGHAVTVVVRDVLTGGAPARGAVLALRDGTFRDSAAATPAPDSLARPLVLGAAPWRHGTYEVEVRAPGYRPWHRRGVVVGTAGKCNNYAPQVLAAWLLPSDG